MVSGEMKEGKNLSIISSLTDKDGLGAFTYSWFRDGNKIADEKNSFYKLTQADVGSLVSASVDYVDGYGTSESANFIGKASVENKNNLPTGEFKILGAEKQGETLTISNTLADEDGLGAFNISWVS